VPLDVLIAGCTARSITRPLRAAVEIARKLTAGDLTSNIETTSQDKLGQLMATLKDMNQSLAKIVREVRSGSRADHGQSGPMTNRTSSDREIGQGQRSLS
jgi:methyl-accepting chemotaxis protein